MTRPTYVPEGYHTVTPYLTVRDVEALISFMESVLDGATVERIADAKGRVMHAEVRVGDSIVMMGQSSDANAAMPATLYLYVEDCDALYAKALAGGATSIREPAKQFYGHRNAAVRDTNGNQWWFATPVEQVSAAELERRAKEL